MTQEKTFEEMFPSLKKLGYINDKDGFVFKKDLMIYCLDKAKVKKSIEKISDYNHELKYVKDFLKKELGLIN